LFFKGPILIDGKRISGKSNGVRAALGHIMAVQVDHIELIRGAAKGLEVQSQGLIVNVVLKEGSNKSTTLWQAGAAYRAATKFSLLGKLTHNGAIDNFTYMLEGGIDQTKFFERSNEIRFNGAGFLYERRLLTSRHEDIRLGSQ
jgi:outer membrane cobalamin receptor